MINSPNQPAGPRRGRPSVFTRLAATALLVISVCPALIAQGADDTAIRELVARLDRGETEAVRQELPDLVAKYQNHPGILYVQARVATDGIESAKLYQSVLDNYPASEWADDALFNLYQYYYAMGLYMTAELRMQQLRKEYPTSEHLAGKPAAPAVAGSAGSAGSVAATDEPDKASSPPPVAVETHTVPPPDAPPSSGGAAPGGAAKSSTATSSTTTGGVAAGVSGAAGSAQTPGEAPGSDRMPYTLQTGAFSTSENAQKQKAWFDELGYATEVTNRVRSGKSLYLVWVGSFANANDAKKVLKDIQSKYNITPIVVER